MQINENCLIDMTHNYNAKYKRSFKDAILFRFKFGNFEGLPRLQVSESSMTMISCRHVYDIFSIGSPISALFQPLRTCLVRGCIY